MEYKNTVPVQDISADADKEQTQSSDKEKITSDDFRYNNVFTSGLRTFTLDEALDCLFEPRRPIIENLLNSGTYIMAGAPKIGKSFLVAEIAFHVATGKAMWNEHYKTHQGEVLYLALEDDMQRIQSRFSRMFGEEGSEKLNFATTSKTVDEGLVLQLAEYLDEKPDTRLIIIDTLQKIRGFSNESISYSRDYEVITQLKTLSDKHNICILIVHHTRKQNAEDCFDKISGTNGLMGSADGAIIMTRTRGETEGTLQITGRDQQDQIITIEQNMDSLIWEFKDSKTKLWKEKQDPVVEKICEFIEEIKIWKGSASELIRVAGLGDIAPNALTRKLKSKISYLVNKRQIHFQTKRSSNIREIYLELKE